MTSGDEPGHLRHRSTGCLVLSARETLHPEFVVCTTDTDFRFYRKNEQDMIPVLASFRP
jgi:hypothetical protein